MTLMPVQIMKVTPDPGGATPTVDFLPLVNQIDGIGTPTKHETVHGVKVQRIQGGKAAFISDPVVGDVGFVMVSHRDISAVVSSNGKQSNPGSYRRFNYADSVYVGHLGLGSNGVPNMFVMAKTNGGWKIQDSAGNIIETNNSGDVAIYVKPVTGKNVYLGGDGVTGTYDFVETVSGPSINVKARIS